MLFRSSPDRKLGWDDRLIGTMRLALSHGVEPRRLAFGAASALATMDPGVLESDAPIRITLEHLWGDAVAASPEKEAVLKRIEEGLARLRCWRNEGFPALDQFWNAPR